MTEERGEGWRATGGVRPVATGACLVVGLSLCWAAVEAARSGVWLAAVLLVPVGCAFLVLPLGRDPSPRRPRLLTPPADPVAPPLPGTATGVLVPARPHRWVTLAAWAVLGLVLLAAGVGIAVDQLASGGFGAVVGALFVVGFSALMLLAAYAGTRHRLAPHQGLLLRPDALVLRTGAVPVTVPWETVTRLRAHWTGRRSRGMTVVVHNWLSIETTLALTAEESTGVSVMAGAGTTPTFDVDSLSVDPSTVLEVCRFYLEHPERRPELETETAVRGVQHWEPPR